MVSAKKETNMEFLNTLLQCLCSYSNTSTPFRSRFPNPIGDAMHALLQPTERSHYDIPTSLGLCPYSHLE